MPGTLLKWIGGSGHSKLKANNLNEPCQKLGELYEDNRGIHDLTERGEM